MFCSSRLNGESARPPSPSSGQLANVHRLLNPQQHVVQPWIDGAFEHVICIFQQWPYLIIRDFEHCPVIDLVAAWLTSTRLPQEQQILSAVVDSVSVLVCSSDRYTFDNDFAAVDS